MGIHSRVFPVVAAIREKGHQDLKKQNMGEPWNSQETIVGNKASW